MLRGSCLCGGIVWEIEGPLDAITHCHCSMCRKSHGVGYATYAGGAANTFGIVSGEERIGRYESSPGTHRCFCTRCGSKVPASSTGERVFVPLGNLDDDPGETHNLADQHAGKAKALLGNLEQWDKSLAQPRWYDGSNWQHWQEMQVKNHRMTP